MKKWLGVALCAFAMLVAACGGGAGAPPSGSIPTDQPTGDQPPTQMPTPAATSTAVPQEVDMASGGVDGAPGAFTPARGDTSTGGSGQTIDGIPCLPTMTQNAYHVHSF